MYDRILVAVDGSDAATAALDHALDIAADDGATVHAINVADTNQPSLTRVGTDVVDALAQEGAGIVSAAHERGDSRDVPMVTDVIQGDPGDVIVDYAASADCDLVAMGTHGHRRLGEYVLGSLTDHVVRTCETPVMAVRADDAVSYPYERVLVPTDGSAYASAAVGVGAEIAAARGAALQLLFVVDDPLAGFDTEGLAESVEAVADEVLRAAVETAKTHGVTSVETAVTEGAVPSEITTHASESDVDLIVMGTHGRTGVDRFLLGSVTERVLRTAAVPVLTTRANDE